MQHYFNFQGLRVKEFFKQKLVHFADCSAYEGKGGVATLLRLAKRITALLY